VGLDLDLGEAAGGEQAGVAVGQGAVAQHVVGAEAQHAPGELLVGDVEDLGVVVRVGEHETTAGGGDADELIEGLLGVGEVLQDAVGPDPVEAAVAKRQAVGVARHDARQAAVAGRGEHGVGGVGGDHGGAGGGGQVESVGAGTGADVEVAAFRAWLEELVDAALVGGVEGLAGQAVQHPDPVGRCGLGVDVGEAVSQAGRGGRGRRAGLVVHHDSVFVGDWCSAADSRTWRAAAA